MQTINWYETEKEAKETGPDSPIQKKILKLMVCGSGIAIWCILAYQIAVGLCK